jgi:hypothetical protein
MTPEEISKLTDQELNELIAVKRGWIYNPYEKFGSLYEPSVLWHNPKTNESFYSAAPDFSGLWRWAGELLVEVLMDNTGNSFEYQPNLFPDRPWAIMGIGGNGSASPTRAIAESWAMWSEQCG